MMKIMHNKLSGSVGDPLSVIIRLFLVYGVLEGFARLESGGC